jgi:RNA recognition motif. (a.k.a. RRM, RBD, or RNP domain)
VQTFFLAEQPNGYFVLNDIFRFLKEETVEGDDVSEPEAESPPAASTPSVSAPEPVSEPVPPPAPAPIAPEPVAVIPTPPPVEEPPTIVIPEPIASTPVPEPPPQKVNGIHVTSSEPEPAVPPAPAVEPRVPTPEPATTTPVPPPASTAGAPAPAPVPASSQPAPPPPVNAAATAPLHQPAAPPVPKTWANLAAANSKKWGAAVAQESRGTTEVPVNPATPNAGTQSPAAHHAHLPNNNTPGRGTGGRDGGVHPAILAAQSVTTAQCFVRGVNEPITPAQLTNVLTQRFGPIKDQAEIVRSKACAFLEFHSLDAAKRAIIACLPVGQGGEGGVRIEVGGEVGSLRIIVETRKERGDRPVSRPRGGAPVNGTGESRGGFRGRGGAGGGGGGGRGKPSGSK